ncbi:spore coat protein U domain-containing protein [Ramlibacter sp.]|uniref:spore coat protein U domain-containing protein n=1 Tax=Ramlibacter sp. TaxID=1917967 RepID=UPI00185C8489|nr:spore coat protein U domain-containing protein [Ramlibacter sp.]MBA2673169.1 spore coat protein U domain-containing protein [Ramlibacter sp.]
MSKRILISALAAAGLASMAFSSHAATVGGSVDVQTTLTAACEISASGAAIDFGSVVALASSGNKAANSGSGFQVACSTGLSPTIYSATTREMDDGATHTLAFNLCLSACTGSNDLASAALSADTLSITQNGSLQTVALHGRILAANFKALPAGSYAKTVTVNVDY